MTRRKLAILAAVGLAVAILAVAIWKRPARRGDQLKLTGTIEVTTVDISFKVAGRLAERLVDEGEMVRAGQVLAKLEDDELKEQRQASLAEQKAAAAALADLQAGSRREEIAQAEATLARLRAEAERAAKDANRIEALFRREVVPQKDLDAARAARDATSAAVNEADQHLKLLKAGPRPDAVRQLKARSQAAAAGLSLAETKLSQGVLISPVTGMVLAKHAEPGEMLAPGTPVVSIGKLEDAWLRAYVPEDELGRIRLGQTVRVTSDSWPGRVFEGKVGFISPQAEFTPKNVQTEKERVKLVYRIKINLANPKMELKPGMPADAVIPTP